MLITASSKASCALVYSTAGYRALSQRAPQLFAHQLVLRPGTPSFRRSAYQAAHLQMRVYAAASKGLLETVDPEDARGAIAIGLKSFEAGDYQGALQLFDKALALPGTGIKRFRDKPAAISDGEKQAAYFNIACCYSKLGDAQKGLVAVAGCIEAGYMDFAQLRMDPDLETLRQDARFEGLLGRFQKKGGPFSQLFEGFM